MESSSSTTMAAQERVTFITLEGKKVLFTNAKDVGDVELMREILRQTIDNIYSQPDKSALVLIDVSNATFNTSFVNEVKNGIKKVTPKILASAYVGLGGIQEIILKGLTKVTKRNTQTFKSIEEAKSWLVTQA